MLGIILLNSDIMYFLTQMRRVMKNTMGLLIASFLLVGSAAVAKSSDFVDYCKSDALEGARWAVDFYRSGVYEGNGLADFYFDDDTKKFILMVNLNRNADPQFPLRYQYHGVCENNTFTFQYENRAGSGTIIRDNVIMHAQYEFRMRKKTG